MEGDRRGRTIGFPTVNLGLGEYLRPAFGVYAVRVSGDGADDPFAGRWIDGVANIGLRPTVGTPEPRLEANLFDIDADLYGRHLRVALVDFIRPERRISRSRRAEGADRRGRGAGAGAARRGAARRVARKSAKRIPPAAARGVADCAALIRPTAALSVPGDLLLLKTTAGMILTSEVSGILGLSEITRYLTCTPL